MIMADICWVKSHNNEVHILNLDDQCGFCIQGLTISTN